MPKRSIKRFNKKRTVSRKRRSGRRLQTDDNTFRGAAGKMYSSAAGSFSKPFAKRKRAAAQRSRLSNRARTQVRGAAVPDASVGGRMGFRHGRKKRMAGVMRKRQAQIVRVLSNSRFPVIKDHQLRALSQGDWVANTQGVTEHILGYTTSEIESMLTQAQDAHYADTSTFATIPAVDGLVNQRMDVYDKTFKINMKNTCSHTVHLEVRLYKCKGYHSFTVGRSWDNAMATDNMLRNGGTWNPNGEQVQGSIGNRPNMSFPDLNVRWGEVKSGRFKIVLEPGQETYYTHVIPGFRFDQARYNVLQGNSVTPVDADYTPHTYSALIFYRGEMVTDALDTDVTYGSGHIALNCELWRSWSAVPYLKPKQASFTQGWGDGVIEANEQDNNQTDVNLDPYFEVA